MTHENPARVRKRHQRLNGFRMLVAMDNVGRERNIVQLIDHLDATGAELIGQATEARRIDDGCRPDLGQAKRQVTRHKLAAETQIKIVIGYENAVSGHCTERLSFLLAFLRGRVRVGESTGNYAAKSSSRQSASINGLKCS